MWNGPSRPGSRRIADSSCCMTSAAPRSIRADEMASPRRWASMRRSPSVGIRRCSTRRRCSRTRWQSRLRIPGERSLEGRVSARAMRGIAIFLAIVLAVTPTVALIHFAPIERWETPPGAGPQLTPPNPAAGGWPPYLRRSPTAPSPTPTQTTGVARILVLLIQFSDTAANPSHDGAYFDSRLNSTGGSVRSVRSYYQEVSRGALTLNATIISTWFTSAHPMSYYGADSSTGVDDANGPIYRLVVEAVHLADPSVNFAPFDTNGDGVVDHLMVVHAGAGQESNPAHLSAWSLMRLGWITPTDVTTSLVGTSIDAVETSGKVFRLSIPGNSLEYFLIENRQPLGFDAALPGGGLLVWHVDDSQTSNDQDTHRLLDLLEADEGSTGDHPVDASDPWHDTASGWGPETVPDSRAYDGSATGWRVRDVSASGATMIATIAHDVTKDLAVSAIRLPFTQAVGALVPTQTDVRNEGAQPANVTLQVEVYRDTLQPSTRVTTATFNRPIVGAQTTATFSLNFTATFPGRYLVHALLVGANDEIPSNDERIAHVLVNTFRFRDPITSAANWSTDGFSNDQYRWRVVHDSDPDGASHSHPSAWRFGYVATLVPNPLPPAWHTLTSPSIAVSPAPTFLIFYHRYDLTGRTVEVLPIGANETDEAYVEVRYGGGPWIKVARYTEKDLTWRVAAFNLTANISGSTTVQVRFNASSNVMAKAGGWWIDDVMIAAAGPARAGVFLGAVGPVATAAGGTARIALKLANVGDYETNFRLDATLPPGWGAGLEGGAGGLLRGHVVRLAPDNDAALRIILSLAGNATAGTSYPATITATALEDPAARAAATFQVAVSSSLPVDLLLDLTLVAAAMAVLVIVVVLRRRRRPRT